jgi:hypothetical protein
VSPTDFWWLTEVDRLPAFHAAGSSVWGVRRSADPCRPGTPAGGRHVVLGLRRNTEFQNAGVESALGPGGRSAPLTTADDCRSVAVNGSRSPRGVGRAGAEVIERGSRLGEVGGQSVRVVVVAPEADCTSSLLGHHCGIHGRRGRPVFISRARPPAATARMACRNPSSSLVWSKGPVSRSASSARSRCGEDVEAAVDHPGDLGQVRPDDVSRIHSSRNMVGGSLP